MIEFVITLLSLSFSGTVLILLLFLLKLLIKHKFSKSWQYYIWLAAALRFLLPFTPETTLSGSIFGAVQDIVTEDSGRSPSGDGVWSSSGDNIWNGVWNDRRQNGGIDGIGGYNVNDGDNVGADSSLLNQTGNSSTAPAGTASTPANRSTCLVFIWSAVALALLLRKITIYQSYMRYLKAGNTEVSDLDTLNLLAGCEEDLHIRQAIELYQNPLIASPVMAGFFKSSIILPSEPITTEEMTCIFRHELTHYKRRDMFYKWLIQIIICLHWFNPFVYLMERELNKACELSCDEAVLRSLDNSSRKIYGDTLLSFIKKSSTYKSNLASVTLTEEAEQLKERLGAIMRYHKKTLPVTVATICSTLLICLSFTAVGAYAAPAKQSTASAEQSTTPAKQSTAPTEQSTAPAKLTKEAQTIDSFHTENSSSGKSSSFYFTQNGYYSDPYIIELGWNLGERNKDMFSTRTHLTLDDATTLPIAFSEEAKQYVNDEKVLTSLRTLISNLRKNGKNNTLPIQTPFVVSITSAPADQLTTLAEEYYNSGELVRFTAVFPMLDQQLQKVYCQKMYDDGQISFFASAIDDMDTATLQNYAKKAILDDNVSFFSVIMEYLPDGDLNNYAKQAYENNNIAFFSTLIEYLPEKDLNHYAELAYEDDNIAFFSTLASKLSEESLRNWMAKALKDNRMTFYSVISDECN